MKRVDDKLAQLKGTEKKEMRKRRNANLKDSKYYKHEVQNSEKKMKVFREDNYRKEYKRNS